MAPVNTGLYKYLEGPTCLVLRPTSTETLEKELQSFVGRPDALKKLSEAAGEPITMNHYIVYFPAGATGQRRSQFVVVTSEDFDAAYRKVHG